SNSSGPGSTTRLRCFSRGANGPARSVIDSRYRPSPDATSWARFACSSWRRINAPAAIDADLLMAFRIRHISTRFALLLAGAAVVPLVAYGAVSLLSLQRGTRESIVAGNSNVVTRAATEIGRYISNYG